MPFEEFKVHALELELDCNNDAADQNAFLSAD